MKRYTLFVLIVMGSAASALAAIAPHQQAAMEIDPARETVIVKNQAFPQVGPLVIEECADESCGYGQS